MDTLELFYPVEPHKVNLSWGIAGPQYHQFGFERHNGVDLNLKTGQAIYAPFDCDVINTGNVPNGSGVFVSVISKKPYLFADGVAAYVLLDFMHCQKILVANQASLPLGEILALGDSTGFSTGDHTHMQPRRLSIQQVADTGAVNTYRIRDNNYILQDVDHNDANDSFDPDPYWNKKYASNYNPEKIAELEKTRDGLLAKLKSLLAKMGIGG